MLRWLRWSEGEIVDGVLKRRRFFFDNNVVKIERFWLDERGIICNMNLLSLVIWE